MESSDATLMVANSSKSLYGGGEPHFILFKDGNFVQTDGKQSTAIELIEILKCI
jgi:phosphopantothenate---cysteine ligase (CTP)